MVLTLTQDAHFFIPTIFHRIVSSGQISQSLAAGTSRRLFWPSKKHPALLTFPLPYGHHISHKSLRWHYPNQVIKVEVRLLPLSPPHELPLIASLSFILPPSTDSVQKILDS